MGYRMFTQASGCHALQDGQKNTLLSTSVLPSTPNPIPPSSIHCLESLRRSRTDSHTYSGAQHIYICHLPHSSHSHLTCPASIPSCILYILSPHQATALTSLPTPPTVPWAHTRRPRPEGQGSQQAGGFPIPGLSCLAIRKDSRTGGEGPSLKTLASFNTPRVYDGRRTCGRPAQPPRGIGREGTWEAGGKGVSAGGVGIWEHPGLRLQGWM